MLAQTTAGTAPVSRQCGLAGPVSAFARGALAAFRWVETCAERRAQRRALLELDDHQLRDIGISRVEARVEARKPAWRA